MKISKLYSATVLSSIFFLGLSCTEGPSESSTSQAATESASGLGGSVSVSAEQKAKTVECARLKAAPQEMAYELARMACYGGANSREARLHAAAAIGCSPLECKQKISFEKQPIRIEIRAAESIGGRMADSAPNSTELYPLDQGRMVWVGIILRPGSATSSEKCIPFDKMPSWQAHQDAVQQEIERVCQAQ